MKINKCDKKIGAKFEKKKIFIEGLKVIHFSSIADEAIKTTS